MNWKCAWLVANVFCIALAALANAKKSSETSKRGLSLISYRHV